MFSKRHEQDLAEIKALTHELSRRHQEVLDRLRRVEDVQKRLLAASRSTTAGEGDEANGDGAVETVSGSKRARRASAAPAVAATGTTKTGTTKREKRRAKAGAADTAPRKRAGGGGRKKRGASGPRPGSQADGE